MACRNVRHRSWIAPRRRNERPADVINCLLILVAREERHSTDRLFGLPVIWIAPLPAKATEKCTDRRRGVGIVKLRIHFTVSPVQCSRLGTHLAKAPGKIVEDQIGD